MDTKEPRRCVYTILLGDYDVLNEQPAAARSTMRFICFTDDKTLTSETWETRVVSPILSMDPTRSQRDIKIRPHLYLPEFEESLYIDNTVILKVPPEQIFDAYFSNETFALPTHSFRKNTLEEFATVLEMAFDDQARIFEQLNNYERFAPDVLAERPFWTAIMLRRHNDKNVRALEEIWSANVLRYSRRDQLSFNLACRQAGVAPSPIEIDNFESWFHAWPVRKSNDRNKGIRNPSVSQAPLSLKITALEATLEDTRKELALTRQHATDIERRLNEDASYIALGKQFSHIPRFIRRALTAAWWTLTLQLPKKLKERSQSNRIRIGARVMYVNPKDARAERLVAAGGNFNPNSLLMWQMLVKTATWTHIVDIGANYGEMLINVELPASATVVAFEPNPIVRSYLKRSLKKSKMNVRTLPLALGASKGKATFLIDTEWSGTSRLQGAEDAPTKRYKKIKAKITTLAHALSKEQRLERLLVKIDVENNEVNVLKGASALFDRLVDAAFLIEIFHLSPEDVIWISERFDVYLLNVHTNALEKIDDETFKTLRFDKEHPLYYLQDAALRLKTK